MDGENEWETLILAARKGARRGWYLVWPQSLEEALYRVFFPLSLGQLRRATRGWKRAGWQGAAMAYATAPRAIVKGRIHFFK